MDHDRKSEQLMNGIEIDQSGVFVVELSSEPATTHMDHGGQHEQFLNGIDIDQSYVYDVVEIFSELQVSDQQVHDLNIITITCPSTAVRIEDVVEAQVKDDIDVTSENEIDDRESVVRVIEVQPTPTPTAVQTKKTITNSSKRQNTTKMDLSRNNSFSNGLQLRRTARLNAKNVQNKFNSKSAPKNKKINPKPFKCPKSKCNKSFKTKQSMNTHKNIVHSRSKPFKCPQLGFTKKFKTLGVCKTHLDTHNDLQPYECPQCLMKFKTKGQSEAHILAMHTMDRPTFPCDICAKPFTTKGILGTHVKKIHKKTNL